MTHVIVRKKEDRPVRTEESREAKERPAMGARGDFHRRRQNWRKEPGIGLFR